MKQINEILTPSSNESKVVDGVVIKKSQADLTSAAQIQPLNDDDFTIVVESALQGGRHGWYVVHTFTKDDNVVFVPFSIVEAAQYRMRLTSVAGNVRVMLG